MPPIYAFPVLFPSLIGLYWLVQSSVRPRAAFGIGWTFGTGFFVVGLYWIGNAFMVNAARHALLAIPSVIGLAGFLGLFIACVCWCQRHLVRQASAGVGGVMVFAALWVFFEWLRSWVFTGFPWNLMGSMWAFSDTMIQSAAYIGTYGLSLITIFLFCLPAVLAEAPLHDRKARRRPLYLLVGVVAVMWAGGSVRLSESNTAFVPDVRLRLVQPNIPQALKWKKELKSRHVLRQLDMSVNGAAAQSEQPAPAPTHVIWAETAVPYVLSPDSTLLDALARAAPQDGALITGVVRSDISGDNFGKPSFWNSLLVLGAKGDVISTYDKVHLVPFGEYMPLQGILPFEKLTAGAGRFTAGEQRPLIDAPGLPPFSPLICYEIIFPGKVSASNGRPGWLLNLTNDAWYGISTGPYQHFVAARMRAVEEGLPVVRVANTGISGVIDAYGRVTAKLDLGAAGVLDSPLPSSGPITPYAKFKNILPLAGGIIFIVSGLMIIRRKSALEP